MTDWLDILKEPLTEVNLAQRLADEKRAGQQVYPAYSQDKILRAFHATPYEEVRVVILGEDTPSSRKHSTGLAFATQKSTVDWPEELTNISKELHNDLGKKLKDPSLESWAAQGVLLLNTHLTSNSEGPESHADWGWQAVIEAALSHLNTMDWPIVFIGWGGLATRLINNNITNPAHHKINGSYPSNKTSYNGFFGTRPFSTCNTILQETGETIDW